MRKSTLHSYGYEFCQSGSVSKIFKGKCFSSREKVYRVPEEIDREIASLKLQSLGLEMKIDFSPEEHLLPGKKVLNKFPVSPKVKPKSEGGMNMNNYELGVILRPLSEEEVIQQ